MSYYSEKQGSSVVIATAPTESRAEVIKATLEAHGFEATISPSFPAYPSVDFVQQLLVSVPPEVEDAARRLLEDLDLTTEGT